MPPAKLPPASAANPAGTRSIAEGSGAAPVDVVSKASSAAVRKISPPPELYG